jgi:uncharacterized protein with PQ loop repeat
MALVAGSASTTLFVVSYLPMLVRAVRTRDLRSYSRSSLVIANIGNVVQACYVASLPMGPLWLLHGFYLIASALMLGLHVRHGGSRSPHPGDSHDHHHQQTRPVPAARRRPRRRLHLR